MRSISSDFKGLTDTELSQALIPTGELQSEGCVGSPWWCSNDTACPSVGRQVVCGPCCSWLGSSCSRLISAHRYSAEEHGQEQKSVVTSEEGTSRA